MLKLVDSFYVFTFIARVHMSIQIGLPAGKKTNSLGKTRLVMKISQQGWVGMFFMYLEYQTEKE